MGLEGGLRVVGFAGARCCCFRFLRERVDSLPLPSDAFGEPGRLRLLDEGMLLRPLLACLPGLPEGVFAPEGGFDALPVFAFSRSDTSPFLSSSFFFSSSLRRSFSVFSESLYYVRQSVLQTQRQSRLTFSEKGLSESLS